ncbi:MAG: APC family permease [Gemmatimonadota bacterium]|nr:APC family permease [Gemmatimonadota bacterium]
MTTDEGLVRAVGVRGLTAGMVNYMIGAGIFVLPATVAARVGGAAPFVYVICAIAIGTIVLCFADAGSRVSLSGGTYAYAQVAFGPFIGFVVAMTLWFSTVLASASVANIFADTLSQITPRFGDPVIRSGSLILVYAVLAAINIRGVKIGSAVVQTVTAAKLAPLLILIGVGLFAINARNLAWTGLPPTREIARTAVILTFAFIGIESALTPSGEVREPARTVPRALFATLALVTLIYIAIQIVAQGVLGAELATNTKAPLAETAKRLLGSWGQMLVILGTAVSTLGYVAGDVLAAPRGIYAVGRDRLLPAAIGAVHSRYLTPHVAILTHAVFCVGFALSGSFEKLIVLSVISTLIVYLICCLATIQLQRRDIRDGGAIPFKVPGGPVIPVIACGIVVWLMTASTSQEVLAMAAMLVAETVLFLLMRYGRSPDPATA